MLAAIRQILERRRARKVWRQYVSEDVIQQVLDGKLERPSLEARHFTFVIVELRPTRVEELASRLATLADLAVELGGAPRVTSHLVEVGFGLFLASPSDAHRSFIDSALAKFGDGIRITFATGDGHVGPIGAARVLDFSFIHPAFPKALEALASTTYGQVRDVS